jgi:hypothetical protein
VESIRYTNPFKSRRTDRCVIRGIAFGIPLTAA